jgi:hypothetical protein
MTPFKGTLIGLCTVCSRPLFVRSWENFGRQSTVCIDCWFDVLDGPARKQEAIRVHERERSN